MSFPEFRFENLIPGDSPHWLLFTGAIAPNSKDLSNPLIQLVLVPLRGDSSGFQPDFSQVDSRTARTAGDIPTLWGGSIWHKGSRVVGKVAGLLKKKLVFVHSTKASPGPVDPVARPAHLTLNIDQHGFSWELMGGLLGKNPHLKAKINCIEVRVSATEAVLIPAGEIIRFFFAGSSVLARQVIRGRLRDDDLWVPGPESFFDPANRVCKIRPRTGFFDLDVRLIAWWLSDPTAYRSAQRIREKLRSIASTGRDSHSPIPPQADLPFGEGARVSLIGDVFKIRSRDIERWLMVQIRSCEFEPPFTALEIYREEQFVVGSDISGKPPKIRNIRAKDVQGPWILTIRGPRGKARSGKISLRGDARFPSLNRVKVSEVIKRVTEVRPPKKKKTVKKPPSPRGSTGKPQGTLGVNPVIINFTDIISIVDELVAMGRALGEPIVAESVTVGHSGDEQFSVFPQPKSQGDVKWAEVHGRPRRAMLFEISYRNRVFYFMDGERTGGEQFCMLLFHRADGLTATRRELEAVLAQCAANYRVGYDADQLPDFALPLRMLHRSNEKPSTTAKRLLRHIRSARASLG